MNVLDTKRGLVIYGASQQTEQLLAEFRYFDIPMPVAIALDKDYITSNEFLGIPVVEFDCIEKRCPPESFDMIVVGTTGIPRLKKKMYDKAKLKGYSLVNYISPGAFVDKDIVMGDNNIIYRGCDLGYSGVMGSSNTIRHQSYVGHQFAIGDCCVISPNCTIGGQCTIGSMSWIGLGSIIRDTTTIGNEVLVGMGAVVTKDVEPFATVVGVPAKVVSYHENTGVDLRNQGAGRSR